MFTRVWHPSKLVLLCMVLVAAACTRKGDEDISRIQLVMPKSMNSNKIGSQATVEQLAHVIINVTGEGMPEAIVYQWDGHDGNTLPDAFALDVPKGNNRLIQILAVYQEAEVGSTSDGGKMNFYYGDVVKTLSASQEGVVIPIASVGTGTIISGRVSGRYLTSTDAGPTGTVNIKYYPPNGRPGLIIEQGAIFNGWFSFFTLAGADFTYELKDGTKLFGSAVNANSSVFAPSNSVMQVIVPVSLRNESWSGTASWKPNEPQYNIYGWFGPGAGTKVMCSGTVGNLTKIASYTNSATMLSSSASVPTVANLIDTITSPSNYYVNGGTSCAGTEFVDKLVFSSSYIDGGGNDNSTVVMGALKPQSSSGSRNAFAQTMSGSIYNFSGEFLPGVYPNIFNQVHIYKRMQNDKWKYEGGAPCAAIAAGAYGFQKVSEVTLSGSAFNFSVDVPTGTGEFTSVAACYALNGQMFNGGGHMLSYYNFNSGGSSTPASDYRIRGAMYNFPSGYCQKFSVDLTDGTFNSSVSNSADRVFALSLSGGGLVSPEIHSTSACNSIISSVTIPAGAISADVWVKVASGSSGMLVASSTGFGAASQQGNFLISTPSPMTSFSIGKSALVLAPNYCEEVELAFLNGNSLTNLDVNSVAHPSFPIVYQFTDNAGSPLNPSFPTVPPTGITIQSDCSASPTVYSGDMPVLAASYTHKFAIAAGGSNPSDFKIALGVSPSFPSYASYPTSSHFVNPTPVADHLRINVLSGATGSGGAYSAATSTCVNLSVLPEDISNNNIPVPAGKALVASLSTTDGSFWSGSGCSGTSNNKMSVQMFPGYTSYPVYYQTGGATNTADVLVEKSEFLTIMTPVLGVDKIQVTYP